jgi:S1-C subfamily serine protease
MRTEPDGRWSRRAGLMLAGALAGALALLGSVRAQGLGLPDLVERAKPSVVLVGTYRETDSPRFTFAGTGFVVGDGLTVVTNAHVLPDPSQPADGRVVQVHTWQGGREWQARAVRVHVVARERDLAVLRLEGGPPVPALTLAAGPPPREGSDLVFMGFPIGGALGFAHVTHRALLASITGLVLPQVRGQALSPRAIRALRDGPMDIFQLDAIAYPGNSGGPVFDARTGEVVGVINMVLARGTRESVLSQPTGITYALPVALLHPLLNDLPR